MQQGGIANLLELLARELHAAIGAIAGAIYHLRQPDRHARDAPRVTVGRRIALLDRVHRREHEAFEQLLDVFVQPPVFDGDRRLAGQRGHQLDRALRVGDDLLLDVGLRRENRIEVAFAVDELQHADDLVLVILHRNDEHRLRAVPVALVE